LDVCRVLQTQLGNRQESQNSTFYSGPDSAGFVLSIPYNAARLRPGGNTTRDECHTDPPEPHKLNWSGLLPMPWISCLSTQDMSGISKRQRDGTIAALSKCFRTDPAVSPVTVPLKRDHDATLARPEFQRPQNACGRMSKRISGVPTSSCNGTTAWIPSRLQAQSSPPVMQTQRCPCQGCQWTRFRSCNCPIKTRILHAQGVSLPNLNHCKQMPDFKVCFYIHSTVRVNFWQAESGYEGG
jgi:hypothetical protein